MSSGVCSMCGGNVLGGFVPCPPPPCPPPPCPPPPCLPPPCPPPPPCGPIQQAYKVCGPVCLPPRSIPGQQPCIIQIPQDPVKRCPKFVCEPCPPPPPTKVWLIKSSPVPQKSFAIAQPPPCIPICDNSIVIPCPPYY